MKKLIVLFALFSFSTLITNAQDKEPEQHTFRLDSITGNSIPVYLNPSELPYFQQNKFLLGRSRDNVKSITKKMYNLTLFFGA